MGAEKDGEVRDINLELLRCIHMGNMEIMGRPRPASHDIIIANSRLYLLYHLLYVLR